MSDTPGHPTGLSRSPGTSEGPVARLSALWRHGQEPDLREFLAGAGRLNAAELTDVLCTDQRQRWLHGQRPRSRPTSRSTTPSTLVRNPLLTLSLASFWRDASWASPRHWTSIAGVSRSSRAAAAARRSLRRPGGSRAGKGRSRLRAWGGSLHSLPAAQTPAVAGRRPEAGSPRGPEAMAFQFDNEAVAAKAGEQTRNSENSGRPVSLPSSVFRPPSSRSCRTTKSWAWPAAAAWASSTRRASSACSAWWPSRWSPSAHPVRTRSSHRFDQERLLLAQLVHPNLVAAYDAGGIAGLPYFVMEFVEGIGLDVLVRQRGPLPVAEACEVVRQAALGLQHLHEHDLVHRDVKPSNLMLTPSGVVKVLDLGLARQLSGPGQEGPITSTGQFLGTLDYMAPEQCDNSHTVDVRADIYSLGCTLYHLLSGRPPFAAYLVPVSEAQGSHGDAGAAAIRAEVGCPRAPDRGAGADAGQGPQ